MKHFLPYIVLLRPQQWVKNAFVFLPLFFHGDMGNAHGLALAALAFVCFSLVASSIYCFNDIFDREADRRHPVKKRRPVASGAVGVGAAYGLMAATFAASMGVASCAFGECRWAVMGVLAFYFAMNLAYCTRLKRLALVDVFVIAVGFVLRVVAGGVACQIEVSQWLVLMTFLLALFLAFAKRRDDVVLYEETGVASRRNTNRYNLPFMNQAIGIVASVTMVCYIMYTVDAEVVGRIGSRHVYLTSVFVLAGLIRYLQLTIVDVKSGSPTRVLLRDRFTQLCIAGWIAAFLLLLYI